jgi:hypothetical protein
MESIPATAKKLGVFFLLFYDGISDELGFHQQINNVCMNCAGILCAMVSECAITDFNTGRLDREH